MDWVSATTVNNNVRHVKGAFDDRAVDVACDAVRAGCAPDGVVACATERLGVPLAQPVAEGVRRDALDARFVCLFGTVIVGGRCWG